MSLATWFSWGSAPTGSANFLPEVYPMPVAVGPFVQTDIVQTYTKILTDVLERTQGIPEKAQPLLWDNCLASEASLGLVSLVARAMEAKSDLYLIYDKAVDVIRRATTDESIQIKADYAKSGKSSIGIYASFRSYTKTDMMKLYSGLEYCVIAALNKSMNLSKAVQYKIADLRASVSLANEGDAKAQAKTIAEALSNGKDVYLDSKDSIETAKVDLEAAKASMDFLDAKRCFYLGLPMSYITGIVQTGMSDTGQADAKAIDRGLKVYFFSIVKPILEALFGGSVTFKSQDGAQVDQAMEALKTFALVDDSILSSDQKKQVVLKLLELA